MNQSLLYHAFGVRKGFTYRSTDYKDCAINIHLTQDCPKRIVCPHCGKEHVICYGKAYRDIRSLPIGSKRTYLCLTIQRYYCKDCKHAWQGDIPFTRGERSYTFKFSRYVIELMSLGLTIKEVSKHLQISWDTIKEIHKAYLHQHYANPSFKHVKHIGIDEFAIAKGHVYKTIVVDMETGHIIYVGDGKGKESLIKFWKKVKKQRVNIETVSSDLSPSYIASVKENAPNAIHVYDHFHVVKLVNEAVDNVRRQAYNKEKDENKRIVMKGNRWLLLYRDKSKFTDDMNQRLNTILEVNKPIATAYYLKEEVDLIWKQIDKDAAETFLDTWCKTAIESKIPSLVKVAKTLWHHKTGILAWYDYHTSNAKVEGINNKIKVLKRNAYGYRDQQYLKLRLLGLHDDTNAKIG